MKRPPVQPLVVAMPPALERLLDNIEDRMTAAKLRKVYEGVAAAMDSLGHLNLVKYEPESSAEGSADLEMWEQMAKPVADTLASVNSAMHAMRKAFPRAFDAPRGPDSETDAADWKRAEEIESILRGTVRRLEFSIEEVRKQLKRPDVVSSRWRLLAELQDVRAGFRKQLGDLVFLTANTMGHVQREHVVPGYQSEVSHMVVLRLAAAELTRVLGEQRQRRLSGVSTEEIFGTVREELLALVGSTAWKAMPAEVKRAVISLRDAVGEGAVATEVVGPLLESCRERLTALVVSMAEPLDAHDREVWAECSARLAQVELQLSLGATGGKRIFSEALEAAEALSGRDSRLDGWLRQAKLLKTDSFAEAELREELEHFKEQLEVLPFH